MAEGVLQTGLREELPLPAAQALGHGDRAVTVAFHDRLDPRQKLLFSELDFRKKQDLRRVALPVGGETACGGDQARVPAHHFHDEKARGRLGLSCTSKTSIGAASHYQFR